MQLRDIAPGSVVTIPAWGGYEKYTVGPHAEGDADIALLDESGNPRYGHSCLRVGIVAKGSVMIWALYQEKVQRGETIDPESAMILIKLSELLPLLEKARKEGEQ